MRQPQKATNRDCHRLRRTNETLHLLAGAPRIRKIRTEPGARLQNAAAATGVSSEAGAGGASGSVERSREVEGREGEVSGEDFLQEGSFSSETSPPSEGIETISSETFSKKRDQVLSS